MSLPVPSNFTPPEGPVTVTFYDAGAHGWHAVQSGGGTYIQYDGTTGLKYASPATKVASGDYTATVPDDICGDVILPQGAAPPEPKIIEITLTDADGKPITGASPTKFNLKCDTYTLKATIRANPDKLLADGIAASTVTANFSVTGPAKFINGQRIPRSQKPIILTTPLGLMEVHFNTSLGVLVPNPANVKTDLSGNASVTVTSADAGIAKVMAQASGVGDAQVNVHFMPKITAVKEDFVEPISPTNYQISTIPANPKDLTISWKFLPAPGDTCGSLTGPASGLGLSKNGFFHGPQKGYENGCPEKWESASQIQVTVTDKDGGSDTKTFSARSLEGRGFVNLP
ncbi:MAG: hypothetical protein Q7K65_00400 [Candidatus Buchananbacteria bacterium]|nr:hypothetical protein [Candidatus Buchananbacteria bacterium]